MRLTRLPLFTLLSLLVQQVSAIVDPDVFPELRIPAHGTEIRACRNMESHVCCMKAYSRWIEKYDFAHGQANITSAFYFRLPEDRLHAAAIICLDARLNFAEIRTRFPERKEIGLYGPWILHCDGPKVLRTGRALDDVDPLPEMRRKFPLKAWCEEPEPDKIAVLSVEITPGEISCRDLASLVSTSRMRLEMTPFDEYQGVRRTGRLESWDVNLGQVNRFEATELDRLEDTAWWSLNRPQVQEQPQQPQQNVGADAFWDQLGRTFFTGHP